MSGQEIKFFARTEGADVHDPMGVSEKLYAGKFQADLSCSKEEEKRTTKNLSSYEMLSKLCFE